MVHANSNLRRDLFDGRRRDPIRCGAPATGERHAHKSQHTWVMLVGNEFPIRRRTHQDQQRPPPDPSHTNSNRDSTNKGSRCTRHTGSLKPDWPEDSSEMTKSRPNDEIQTRLAGRTPMTWSAHPRSPTISHDIDGSRARRLVGLESAPTISFGTVSYTHLTLPTIYSV